MRDLPKLKKCEEENNFAEISFFYLSQEDISFNGGWIWKSRLRTFKKIHRLRVLARGRESQTPRVGLEFVELRQDLPNTYGATEQRLHSHTGSSRLENVCTQTLISTRKTSCGAQCMTFNWWRLFVMSAFLVCDRDCNFHANCILGLGVFFQLSKLEGKMRSNLWSYYFRTT